MTLADQNTGVVDGLGEAELVDASLETTLQEILNLQGQDVIELHAGLVEHTDADQTTNEGISFEETLGVLLVHGEKVTVYPVRISLFSFLHNVSQHVPSSTTNLRECELDTPHLTLVAETVFADNLQFGVTGGLLEPFDMGGASSRSVANGVY
jgi:hypothetical protein